MRGAYALVLVLGACSGGESPDTCERLVERIEKCGGSSLPMGVMWKTKMYCRVSMSYEPEPGDGPNNLAALMKGAMTECAGPQAATCDGLHACFERHRCSFLMTSPTDVPEFQCWQ